MQQNIRCALEGKNESADSLQNTQSGNALVIVLVVHLSIISDLALLLQKLTNNAHVSIAQLLAKRYGERSEFCGEDFDEILHHVGQSIDIGLVGELEKLLHDGRNALLHAGSDKIVSDEGLQGEGRSDTNGERRVRHAVQNVSVNCEEVVLVLEIQLLKFLDCVASTSTEVALRAGKVGEDITDKEVFNLIGNRALLSKNNRCQSSNHSKSTLLGNVVLLVIRSLFVLVDNSVNKGENLKSLLSAVLCEVNEEVGGGHIGSRCLLKVVQLSVKVLFRLVLELLHVVLGEAKDWENEVGNEVGQMSLQVSPHLLGSDRLVEEDQGVRETRSAEPGSLGNPFLDFREIVLQNLRGNISSKVLCELEGLVTLAWAGRVTVSGSC